MRAVTRRFSSLLLLLVVVVVGACGGGGGGGGGGTEPSGPVDCTSTCSVSGGSATVEVGSGGATIAYTGIPGRAGISLHLVIPALSVADGTTITIRPTNTYPANADVIAAL